MEIELKPCPFCGGTDVVCHLDKSGSGYFVLCEGCEARGPSASSMTGAEFDWSEAVATAAKLAKVRSFAERMEAAARDSEGRVTGTVRAIAVANELRAILGEKTK